MTKAIRIENADTSDYQVRVYSQVFLNGKWEDVHDVVLLQHPTAMTTNFVYKGKRLIVEELGE